MCSTIHTYICVCIYMDMYIYVYVYICVCIYMDMYIYVYAYICVWDSTGRPKIKSDTVLIRPLVDDSLKRPSLGRNRNCIELKERIRFQSPKTWLACSDNQIEWAVPLISHGTGLILTAPRLTWPSIVILVKWLEFNDEWSWIRSIWMCEIRYKQ